MKTILEIPECQRFACVLRKEWLMLSEGMAPKICCEGRIFSVEECGVTIPGVSTAD